jgi:SAM-dependent methyltransferase
MPPAHRPPVQETEELAAFLTAERVSRSARILDAPCGIGHRAFELAEHGFQVTAVDSNEVAIEALRRRVPEEMAGRLTYRVASRETMPGPPVAEPFDAILCLDHALGRGTPEDDRDLLARLRGHLASGGVLLVDFLHRDFFAARPRPFAYHVVGDLEQHEFRTFDPASGILEQRWRFYQRAGTDLRFRGDSNATLKLLTPHEARGLLERAGWKVEATYGGWGKDPVSTDRRKFILVARPSARG